MLWEQQTTCESIRPHLSEIRRSARNACAPRPFGSEQKMGKSMGVSEAAVFETEASVDHHKKAVIRLSDRNRGDSRRQSCLGGTNAQCHEQFVDETDGPFSKRQATPLILRNPISLPRRLPLRIRPLSSICRKRLCNGVDLEFRFQIGESSRHRAHMSERTRPLIFSESRMGAEQFGNATYFFFLVVGDRGQELGGATAIERCQSA
jgi:hypothetical protein